MEVLYIVLPLSLLFSALAVGIFVWAAKNGQFDDLDTPAMRVLFDEKKHTKKPNNTPPNDPPTNNPPPNDPPTPTT